MNSEVIELIPEHTHTSVLVSREPVFDDHERVIGYELLLEGGATPVGVVATTFGDVGLRRVVGDQRAHINATAQLLADAPALRLPAERVVLHLTEQPLDEELIDAARHAVGEGFALSVGGWALDAAAEPLLALATTVKVDFDFGTRDLARVITRRDELHGRGATLIAARVETRGEYDECRRLGFDGFQGPFLAQPSGVGGRSTPTHRMAALAELLNATGPGAFEDLERLICQDAGLAHRFLRLADSAFYTSRTPVRSIRDALARLGAQAVRRWTLMLLLAGLADTTCSGARHLLGVGLHRARICQLLAHRDPAACPDRAFTAGLLSILPALLDQPITDLLLDLPIEDRLARALIDHRGPEGTLLAATIAYEHGRRADHDGEPALLAAITRIYAESLLWADDTAGQLG